MTVNPQQVFYGRTQMYINNLGIQMQFRGWVFPSSIGGPGGFSHEPSYGDAHFRPDEDLTVHVRRNAEAVTGLPGTMYAAIVEDGADPNGAFTTGTGTDAPNTAAGVHWFGSFGNGSVLVPGGVQSRQAGVLNLDPGTYRLVLINANGNASGRRGDQVDTGVGSPDGHRNSDFNEYEGGASTANFQGSNNNTLFAGRFVIMAPDATVFAVGAPDDLHYGETITARLDLDATPVNPKDVEFTFDNGAEVKTHTATVNGSGVATGATQNIDTEFSLTPDDYTVIARVTDDGGTGTPLEQRPDIFTQADASTDANPNVGGDRRAWISFGTVSETPDPDIEDAGTTTIASGIAIDTVEVHDDAARTKPSRLFRRPWDGNYEHPYLRATILDAYGDPLVSTDVTMKVRRGGTSTDEDSHDGSTDASGEIEWDYAIATADTAYNRHRTAGDTATLSVDEADVADANPYPFVDGNTDYRGPYPAYAKDVQAVGREFGSNEPTDTAADVFGVSSEITTPNLWTGDAGQANEGADDAPTGTVSRFKNLGTGSPRAKPSSEIDEGNAVVVDLTREIVRDAAGRTVETASDIEARWAGYNVTLAQEELAETDANNQTRLGGALGYPNQFVTLAPPGDPSVVQYVWAFATTTSQRNTFTQVDGSTRGFSGDTGLYGYTVQALNFTAVDPNLGFRVAADRISSWPGNPVTITAEMTRMLATQVRVAVEPDDPLHIYIDRRDPDTGLLEQIVSEPMTAIAGEDSMFEYEFTPTTAASFTVTVTGFKDGSRPPDAGDIAVFTGGQNPSLDLVVDIVNETSPKGHLRPLDSFLVAAYVVDDTDGSLVDLDSAEAALVRLNTDGTMVETWDGTDWVDISGGQMAVYHPLTSAGDHFESESWTIPSGDVRDIVVNVRGLIDGVTYFGELYREVVGPFNGHRDGFVPTLLWVPTDSTVRGSHWLPGESVVLSFSLFDPAGTEPEWDADPEVAILRLTAALGLEYLESDLTTWTTYTDLASAYLSMPGGTLTIADTSTFDTGDLILVARGDNNEATYSALTQIEVVDGTFRHGNVREDWAVFLGLGPGRH